MLNSYNYLHMKCYFLTVSLNNKPERCVFKIYHELLSSLWALPFETTEFSVFC